MIDRPPASTTAGPAVLPPLTGVRVIEIGHAVSAPLCARHLADLGADVIKIESPQGDLARGYDSVVHGTSAYFAWANYGKRSVVADLKTPEGVEFLRELLAGADVLVHNLGPGAMDRLGFGADAVTSLNPALVNCRISGYGAEGPLKDRKAFDLLVQGESGLMSVTGTESEPAKVGVSIVDMCTAVYALSAIEAALLRRTTTGSGAFIDLTMLDCISEWMMAPAYHQLYAGRAPRREGARHNMMVPYGVYRTGAETSINFAVQTQTHWRLLCDDVLGEPELAQDPGFSTNSDRVANRERLETLLERRFQAIGHDDVLARLLSAGIPVAEVNDLAGLTNHPQLSSRGRWFEITTAGGPVRALRPPFNLDHCDIHHRAVPQLGEHTDSIQRELSARARTDA